MTEYIIELLVVVETDAKNDVAARALAANARKRAMQSRVPHGARIGYEARVKNVIIADIRDAEDDA